MAPTTKPYGSWASPISARDLVAEMVRLEDPRFDGGDRYWVEGRPSEGGRSMLVRLAADGTRSDVLPEGFSVRTLVHTYGGIGYAVRDGVVFFTNANDQRVYRLDAGSPPQALTGEPPSPGAWRFAEPVVTPDGSALVCVRERDEAGGVVNDLVLLDAQVAAPPRVLAHGHDFFAAPCFSADATALAWIAWDHPQMPWDGTSLYEAAFDGLTVSDERLVCGGPRESVLQPRYGRDGRLFYVSDRSGWWNLYADGPDGGRALTPRDAEFAGPLWNLGQSTYGLDDDGRLVATWFHDGTSHLGLLGEDGAVEEVASPWTWIDAVTVDGGRALLLAGSATVSRSIVEVRLSDGECTTLKVGRPLDVDSAYVAVAEPLEFPTANASTSHGYYYAPTNPDFTGPVGERPPLIVASHSGPTSNTATALNPAIQYWTTRGFAVVDVDYGGSSGYGRPYRDRLRGSWGVVDLADCLSAARFLVDTGRVDPKRLLIHGSSAGGYTTLCALTFTDAFAAGASYYGVGDLGLLARNSNKFESRYLDALVGPWPERRDLYEQRSPVFHGDLATTPVILFQGLDDPVVPPTQSAAMAAALDARGVPYAHVTFEGEGHGFRRAENIVRAAEAELYFYGRVLGFTPDDDIEPVDIKNADALP
jgi:dipeptidyl aminopeptidase/acylaminoacyl peptidase